MELSILEKPDQYWLHSQTEKETGTWTWIDLLRERVRTQGQDTDGLCKNLRYKHVHNMDTWPDQSPKQRNLDYNTQTESVTSFPVLVHTHTDHFLYI